MQQKLIVVALGVAFLAVTGCSTTTVDTSASPSAGAASPVASSAAASPSPAGLSATEKKACEDYKKPMMDLVTATVLYLRMVDNKATTDTKESFLAQVKQGLAAYRMMLSTATAQSPTSRLRAALEADLASVDANVKAIESAGRDYDLKVYAAVKGMPPAISAMNAFCYGA
ncbi:MAG TPA: hypothetical protein DGT23_30390 [Micromonosporaceae bacterium]|nr:hypothetical protein [Micromonosporaceae bacterium]